MSYPTPVTNADVLPEWGLSVAGAGGIVAYGSRIALENFCKLINNKSKTKREAEVIPLDDWTKDDLQTSIEEGKVVSFGDIWVIMSWRSS